MTLGNRAPVHSHFSPTALDQVTEILHQAAGQVEPKTPGLRRLTIGLAYSDLVREGLIASAPDLNLQVFHGNPTIYGIGNLRLIHYSVHLRTDTFVTNQGKRLVREYLERKSQMDLPTFDIEMPVRLRGDLAILATDLEVGSRSGGIRSVSLTHAFLGFPARVSDDAEEIVAWEEPVFDLTSLSAATEVRVEHYEKLEEIKPRADSTVGSTEQENRGEK
jgi:hypothetical protein